MSVRGHGAQQKSRVKSSTLLRYRSSQVVAGARMVFVCRADFPENVRYRVCIVGGGASGLTVASDLARGNVPVCVLESEGIAKAPRASELGSGQSTGLPYAPLATSRLRGYGGSTQVFGWGGLCKPLDELDFAARPWVPHSGWPFGREHLMPYYLKAKETLGVEDVRRLSMRDQVFVTRSETISSDNVELCRNYRLGNHLKAGLEKSASVHIFLHATVLYFQFDEAKQNVVSVLLDRGEQAPLRIHADVFVLAAGGLENARLLLLSDCPGSDRGLVGRFFMDHPRFTVGTLVPANRSISKTLLEFDRIRVARRQRIEKAIGLTPGRHFIVKGLTLPFEMQERERLLNYRAWLEPCYLGQDADKLKSLRESLLAYRELALRGEGMSRGQFLGQNLRDFNWTKLMHLVRPSSLVRSFRMHHILEPEPDPESRISLSSETDRFGLRKLNMTWRLASATLDSLRRTVRIFEKEFRETGLAQLETAPAEWEALARPMWTWHHMGTTRMHTDPRLGVVDAQCRVHGVNNLFVAGSSIFPTAGNDTPTFTVVALAHRLADHLVKVMGA